MKARHPRDPRTRTENGVFAVEDVEDIVGALDGNGNEQAKRMVGVGSLDFYGWYLDIRIKKALKRIQLESLSSPANSQGTTS